MSTPPCWRATSRVPGRHRPLRQLHHVPPRAPALALRRLCRPRDRAVRGLRRVQSTPRTRRPPIAGSKGTRRRLRRAPKLALVPSQANRRVPAASVTPGKPRPNSEAPGSHQNRRPRNGASRAAAENFAARRVTPSLPFRPNPRTASPPRSRSLVARKAPTLPRPRCASDEEQRRSDARKHRYHRERNTVQHRANRRKQTL
jgi:hypothetical protein